MTIRTRMMDMDAAKASARELTQRRTCEGCASLRKYPRPMCSAESSPHFRLPRDTYHERCPSFSVAGMAPAPKPEPEAPKPAPKRRMKLVKVRGSDRVVSEDEYDAMLARNRGRRQAT